MVFVSINAAHHVHSCLVILRGWKFFLFKCDREVFSHFFLFITNLIAINLVIRVFWICNTSGFILSLLNCFNIEFRFFHTRPNWSLWLIHLSLQFFLIFPLKVAQYLFLSWYKVKLSIKSWNSLYYISERQESDNSNYNIMNHILDYKASITDNLFKFYSFIMRYVSLFN